MDLTKFLKLKNDYETAELLGVTPTMVGKYKKGFVPHYKTILDFQKRTKGKINFYTFFKKDGLKTNQ